MELTNNIIEAVCTIFDVTPESVYGVSRVNKIVLARHSIFLILKRNTNLTLGEIGEVLRPGGKKLDHATVIHGINAAEAYLTYDGNYIKKYNVATDIVTEIIDRYYKKIVSELRERMEEEILALLSDSTTNELIKYYQIMGIEG